MLKLDITTNTLIAIIILSTLLLLVFIIIFIAFTYHTKRKFDSIDKYNKLLSDKLCTYQENQKQYKNNLEDSGIECKNNAKKIFKIIKSTIDIFKGSK